MDHFYKPTSLGLGLDFRAKNEIKRISATHSGKKILFIHNKPQTQKGETSMRIKFKSYESTKTNPNAAGKTYNIIRVKGTALSGKLEGEDWQTQVFASAKEMVGQIKSMSAGDIVDVKMVKNGNFWNPTAFTKVENESAAPSVVSNASQPVPVVNNSRLENLKVAVGILGPKAKKDVAADYIMQAGEIADLVQNYVDKEGVFQFDNRAEGGIPSVDDAKDDGTQVE